MRIIAIVMGLTGVGAACSAQQRVQPTEYGAKLLSETLPDTLADFVKRSGADRPLDDATAELLEDLDALATDYEGVIELLGPSDWFVVHEPWIFAGAIAADNERSWRGGVPTLLVAGTNVSLAEGVEIEFGGEVRPGDVIIHGMVLNAGDTPILLESLSAEEVITVHPGQAIIVVRPDCLSSCSVTCAAGYYACCWGEDNCAYCYCRANGKSDSKCQSGGPGSPTCSGTLVQDY